MRVLDKLILDRDLTDVDKTVFIGMHYSVMYKEEEVVDLKKIEKLIGIQKTNVSRSIKKLVEKNFISKVGKSSQHQVYEFVMPSSENKFKSINEEYIEKLFLYPKFLVMYLKIEQAQYYVRYDTSGKFTNQSQALRYVGLSIDDFEETMNFLKKLGIVKEYEIKLQAIFHDGTKLFSEFNDEMVIKNETKTIIKEEKPKPTPKTKKQEVAEQPKENAKTLLTYFYQQINSTSANFPKEVKLIDNVIKKTNYEQTKQLIDYMIQNQKPINLINNAYAEYNEYTKIQQQLTQTGTAAYLLQKYYDGMKLPINKSTITKETQKIQAQINTDGYEATEKVIDYMISKQTPSINFIANMRNEALANKATATKKLTNDNNPCFRDDVNDDSIYIMSAISTAQKKLSNIKEEYSEEIYNKCLEKSIKLFMEKSFTPKYSRLEWAFIIKLPINNKMYQVLKEEGFELIATKNNEQAQTKVKEWLKIQLGNGE
jgi:predicted transcriptional regulator